MHIWYAKATYIGGGYYIEEGPNNHRELIERIAQHIKHNATQ
jgi:hypothetical protein